MTTPLGGSPDEKPDATHGRAPDPDPDVTSFSSPPQGPPPSWPAAGAAAPPPSHGRAAAPSHGWSEEGVPVDDVVAPADPTAAWTPPAPPPADATRAGWPAPPPDPRAGFAGPSGWGPPPAYAPPSWPASPGPPPDSVPTWAAGPPAAPGGQPTWAPGQQSPWAAPSPQPGWGPPPAAPGRGAPPEQSGRGAPPERSGWAPPQGGWGATPGPPPGSQPTQVGAPWAQQPAWGAPQPGWGPPTPPRRDNGRLIALIAVGVLLLAALGVGGYLVLRGTAPGAAEVPADFRTITTGTLSYAVPPDWVDSTNALSILGAPLEGRADAPGYMCAGAQYFRGLAASAFVPGERPAAAVADTFARETGQVFYLSTDGGVPDVQVSAPRPFDVDGVQGQLVEATSTTPADDGCLATSGTVLLLALPTTGPDGSPGTAVLVVNGDTAGGPATAPPLADRATLDAVLSSARLPSI